MSSLALYVFPHQILQAKKAAAEDVAVAQKRVNIALSFVGHCADFFGAFFVRQVNQRLANSLVRLKGIVALIADLDPNELLDSDGDVARQLERLQAAVNELHAAALKARDDFKLRRTHEAFRENVELCTALHEAVGELKIVITDHDAKATMGDDARRLMADLRRTDDVPPGRYADIAAALRNVPQKERRVAR
jgi:hypothetical protein